MFKICHLCALRVWLTGEPLCEGGYPPPHGFQIISCYGHVILVADLSTTMGKFMLSVFGNMGLLTFLRLPGTIPDAVNLFGKADSFVTEPRW